MEDESYISDNEYDTNNGVLTYSDITYILNDYLNIRYYSNRVCIDVTLLNKVCGGNNAYIQNLPEWPIM